MEFVQGLRVPFWVRLLFAFLVSSMEVGGRSLPSFEPVLGRHLQ